MAAVQADLAGAKKKDRSGDPATGAPAPAPVAAPACAGADVALHSLALDQINATIACLINQERASRGLPVLRIHSKLRNAASAHNTDMQQRLHSFTHAASNGDPFKKRIGRSGYMKRAKRWLVGEVLDQTPGPGHSGPNPATPNDALVAWLQSPAHNRVLHVAKFRDFGVATARGTAEDPSIDGALITVDFGYRKK